MLTITSDGVLDLNSSRRVLDDTLPGRYDIAGLEGRRTAARNNFCLGIRADDRDRLDLVRLQRQQVQVVLKQHHALRGELSAEFAALRRVTRAFCAVAVDDVLILTGELLDKREEVGDSSVDFGDEDLSRRDAVVDERGCTPTGRTRHFEVKASVYSLVDAVSTIPVDGRSEDAVNVVSV